MSPRAHLSRRQFLAGAVTAGAAGAVGLVLAKDPLGPSSAPALPTTAKDSRLVLLTLYGGNDGLNTVIPYEDGNYLSGRGALAYQPSEVIPLADGLALHPELKGFKTLWDSHQLAIVRGVGYPDPSFSHFRSMDIWQSAVPETDVDTGWLGRWLDATGTDPLRALSIGPTLPLAFSGDRVRAAALPEGSLRLPGSSSMQASYAALEQPTRGEPVIPSEIAQSGSDLLRVQHTLSEYLSQSPGGGPTSLEGGGGGPGTAAAGGGAAGGTGGGGATTPGGAAPRRAQAATRSGQGGNGGAGALAPQLDTVSRLIRAGAPSRVYGVSLGGFDTHANEKATQARLLGEVDQAVTSFVKGMAADPHGRATVMVIYTEFGRRVASNASGGTDHGSAGPVFVVGPGVKGGFYGDEPSLANLDDGNLRFTTDFRSVYATLLERVVGVDPKAALSQNFPTLSFV